MGMNVVEQGIHMVGGAGETSYANNSTVQEKAIIRTKPMLEKAIEDVYTKLLPKRMVVVDLGCSSGPNTFLFLSQVLGIVGDLRQRLKQINPPEIQFFLNDLPANDFNNIFRSLDKFQKQIKEEKGDLLVPHFIAGLPGSFYGRLFPSKSVDFFYSSYCLMWLSQVPGGLVNEDGAQLNKGKISIGEMTAPQVMKAYQEQHETDFSTFLKSRYEELSDEGGMLLTFSGRKIDEHPGSGLLSYLFGLLAEALYALASEGIIEEEQVDAFNLPIFEPSIEEAKAVIEREGLFRLEQAHFLEPDDDSRLDKVETAKISAKILRAAVGPFVARQFGEGILDELFSRYADYLSRDMMTGKKTEKTELVIALRKKTT